MSTEPLRAQLATTQLEWSRENPPGCEGVNRPHRERPMVLLAVADDGALIWRCPRCLYVWRERP